MPLWSGSRQISSQAHTCAPTQLWPLGQSASDQQLPGVGIGLQAAPAAQTVPAGQVEGVQHARVAMHVPGSGTQAPATRSSHAHGWGWLQAAPSPQSASVQQAGGSDAAWHASPTQTVPSGHPSELLQHCASGVQVPAMSAPSQSAPQGQTAAPEQSWPGGQSAPVQQAPSGNGSLQTSPAHDHPPPQSASVAQQPIVASTQVPGCSSGQATPQGQGVAPAQTWPAPQSAPVQQVPAVAGGRQTPA